MRAAGLFVLYNPYINQFNFNDTCRLDFAPTIHDVHAQYVIDCPIFGFHGDSNYKAIFRESDVRYGQYGRYKVISGRYVDTEWAKGWFPYPAEIVEYYYYNDLYHNPI